MRLGPTSITVTGMESPSSVNTRVIPRLRPISPILISAASIQLDLNIDARSQIQLHQGINGLVIGIDNIQQPLVGADFVLITRILVDMRCNQQRVALLARWQGNGPTHLRTRALGGINDFLG